jgi:hypothetical protein
MTVLQYWSTSSSPDSFDSMFDSSHVPGHDTVTQMFIDHTNPYSLIEEISEARHHQMRCEHVLRVKKTQNFAPLVVQRHD